ncbi:Aminotransferase-like, plant mobile domain [Sesbania bispinosa]|nr:Aminotransferase-like, plant mobile domain [Sesbania bispinosa]
MDFHRKINNCTDAPSCPELYTDIVVRRVYYGMTTGHMCPGRHPDFNDLWLEEEVEEVMVHLAEVEVMQKSESGLLHLPEHVVYEGGPRDTSLLRSFESHVARQLWSDEDRGTLKVVTHGRKLKRPENNYVRDIVDDSGLGPLVEGTHSLVNKSLLSMFSERWNKDTSNFHLPMGEMTITLDDVNNLLHIPVRGSNATAETEHTWGPSVRLSWLRSMYENNVEKNHLTYAARAYLPHLVGCTKFADKSASTV